MCEQIVCVKRLYRRKTSMALLNLVFWYLFQLSNKQGDQASSDWPDPTKLGHWKGSGLRTLSHVPASCWIFVWQGAKPRTPTTAFGFLDSFSFLHLVYVVFRYHGKGLSREPYQEHLFIWGLCLWHFILGVYLILFLVMLVFIGIPSHYSDTSSRWSTLGHWF